MVRLADEQGRFRQAELSPVQWWAMTYMLSYKRRFLGEVRDDFLKHFLLLTDPKRYVAVFASPLAGAIVEEASLPVDPREFDKIDSYLASLDKVRGASGAQLADDEGWL